MPSPPTDVTATAPMAPPVRPAPRRTLVLGPSASGKSAFAEGLLDPAVAVQYVATGPVPDPSTATDGEWAARIESHRRRRPPAWVTRETEDVAAVLLAPGPPVLVDSLGAWVAGLLDRCGAWDDAPGWRERADAETDQVVDAWRRAPGRVVAVSDEVGWGVVPATVSGRVFCDALGNLNQRVAAVSDEVLLVVAGRVVALAEPPGRHQVST